MGTSLRLFCVAAAAVLATILYASQLAAVGAGDRTLSLYNIHNGERLTATFKRGEVYDQDALKQLNWFFRDWRQNEPTTMDPKLFDIIWEIHTELGSKQPVHLISGYRSPGTNEKLRKKGGGQAKRSRHMLGKASDIHFPDVPVQKIRYSALVREAGGVGYYPTSAKPFVHIDTDRVRMWPRMPRQELALLFPNGRSKFVPADGKPITPADVRMARTRYAQLAQSIAAFHAFRASPKDRTLVASLSQTPLDVTASTSNVSASELDSHDHAADSWDAEATAVVAGAPSPPAPKLALARLEDSDGEPPALEGPALAPELPAAMVAEAAAMEPVPAPVMAQRPKLASLGATIMPSLPEGVKKKAKDLLSKALPIGATATKTKKTKDAAKTTLAALVPPAPVPVDQDTFLSTQGWASAPEYDEDHDDELSYRPFPISPLLTADASVDNPVLANLVSPDIAGARDMVGRSDDLSMGLRFNPQLAELMWGDRLSTEDVTKLLASGSRGNYKRTGKLVTTSVQ